MTAELERAYHRAIAWYPRSWRDEHGQEMVEVLLDLATGERRDRPRVGELADLAWNGLLTRLRTLPGVVPQGMRDRTADVALGAGAMLALVMFFAVEWSPWAPRPSGVAATFGVVASPASVGYVLWAAAFIASIAGFARASRGLVLTTLPLWIAVRAVSDAAGYDLRPSLTTTALFTMLAVLSAIGHPARGSHGTVRLSVAAVVSLLMFAIPAGWMLQRLGPDVWMLQDPYLPWATGWLPCVAVGLAVLLRLTRRRAWAGAALLSAAPWLLVAAFGARDTGEIVAIAGTVGLGVLLLCAVLALVRMFGFRVTVQRVTR